MSTQRNKYEATAARHLDTTTIATIAGNAKRLLGM
jgi:hypothetical protein